MEPMKTIKNQRILIFDPDTNFQQELYNFLLSAGYEQVDLIESLDKTLDKINQLEYDIVILDAGLPCTERLKFMNNLITLNPNMRIILMIQAEDPQKWNEKGEKTGEFQFLIKTTFAQNLLYLMEGYV